MERTSRHYSLDTVAMQVPEFGLLECAVPKRMTSILGDSLIRCCHPSAHHTTIGLNEITPCRSGPTIPFSAGRSFGLRNAPVIPQVFSIASEKPRFFVHTASILKFHWAFSIQVFAVTPLSSIKHALFPFEESRVSQSAPRLLNRSVQVCCNRQPSHYQREAVCG